jgi:hypothetical protein
MACTTTTTNLGASTAASTSRRCETSTGASRRRPGKTQSRAEAWRTCGRCGGACVGAPRSALPPTGRDGSRSQERPRASEIEGSPPPVDSQARGRLEADRLLTCEHESETLVRFGTIEPVAPTSAAGGRSSSSSVTDRPVIDPRRSI